MMSIKKLQVLDYKINADTLDDKHASDFASASDMTEAKDNIDDLQAKVGDESVSSQIATSIENKVDKVDGKGLSANDYTTDEKNKLSNISSGAEVNQNAFSSIVIGANTILADNKTDILTFEAGDNIILAPDVDNDKIVIAAKNTEVISNDIIDQICDAIN